jgi:hypothetical protein
MNRRSPCDCEHCQQDRIYRRNEARKAEITRLYEQRLHVSPSVDRKAAALVTLFFALAILGVAASWWVHT